VMKGGRIVQEGTPIDLYSRPSSLFVAAFFGEINRLTGHVATGRVETPLGSVMTELPEGASAEVVIRPEAVPVSFVETPGAGTRARVVSVHPLGRSTRLLLALEDGGLVKARIWGLHRPKPGAPVTVGLDPRQAFVFPAD
jgi:iron(III) transport system ATP-binding protein